MTTFSLSRRAFVGSLAALAACTPKPRSERDVLAAGQPAAILLLAVAPQRMIGWPRRPPAEVLALLPGSDLPETGALSGGGRPAGLEAVAALGPGLIVDYGDVDPAHKGLAERVERRLATPCRLLDGSLRKIPEALRSLGEMTDRRPRGEELAARTADLLGRWEGGAGTRPSFYYARGGDGLETGFAGSLATEVLEGAGWTNVAAGGSGIGRVGREQVAAWDPEVIVTLDQSFAERASSDPTWSKRRAGAERRILRLPDLPFGWIDRPPSINRLLGCAWVAGGEAGASDARELARFLWGARLPAIAPRWID